MKQTKLDKKQWLTFRIKSNQLRPVWIKSINPKLLVAKVESEDIKTVLELFRIEEEFFRFFWREVMFKVFSLSMISSHLGDQIWSRMRTCKLSRNVTIKLFRTVGLGRNIPIAKENSFGTKPLIKSRNVNSSAE